MRIFKTKWFSKFAKSNWINDADLVDAIERAERGLVDADLGGGVIKQRIARTGEGKSGGYRSIILLKREERAFFVYGFAKNERQSIRPDELQAFRDLAIDYFAYSSEGLLLAKEKLEIAEIGTNEKNI